jgi:hypothetical protein
MAYQTLKGINLNCEQIELDANDYQDEWKRKSSKYKCTIRANGQQFTTPFYMGSAHKNPPTTEDVMFALTSDASIYASSPTIKDFMDEMGYEDIKEAKPIYNSCRKIHGRLNTIFGCDHLEAMTEELRDY